MASHYERLARLTMVCCLSVLHSCGTPASQSPTGLEPQRTVGTADPIRVLAADRLGRWAAYCQAREDTNEDGVTGVHYGRHGEIFGDAMTPYLTFGEGPGEGLRYFYGASVSGNWVAARFENRTELRSVEGEPSLVFPSPPPNSEKLPMENGPLIDFSPKSPLVLVAKAAGVGLSGPKLHRLGTEEEWEVKIGKGLLLSLRFSEDGDSLEGWVIPQDTNGNGKLDPPTRWQRRLPTQCGKVTSLYTPGALPIDKVEPLTVKLSDMGVNVPVVNPRDRKLWLRRVPIDQSTPEQIESRLRLDLANFNSSGFSFGPLSWSKRESESSSRDDDRSLQKLKADRTCDSIDFPIRVTEEPPPAWSVDTALPLYSDDFPRDYLGRPKDPSHPPLAYLHAVACDEAQRQRIKEALGVPEREDTSPESDEPFPFDGAYLGMLNECAQPCQVAQDFIELPEETIGHRVGLELLQDCPLERARRLLQQDVPPTLIIEWILRGSGRELQEDEKKAAFASALGSLEPKKLSEAASALANEQAAWARATLLDHIPPEDDERRVYFLKGLTDSPDAELRKLSKSVCEADKHQRLPSDCRVRWRFEHTGWGRWEFPKATPVTWSPAEQIACKEHWNMACPELWHSALYASDWHGFTAAAYGLSLAPSSPLRGVHFDTPHRGDGKVSSGKMVAWAQGRRYEIRLMDIVHFAAARDELSRLSAFDLARLAYLSLLNRVATDGMSDFRFVLADKFPVKGHGILMVPKQMECSLRQSGLIGLVGPSKN